MNSGLDSISGNRSCLEVVPLSSVILCLGRYFSLRLLFIKSGTGHIEDYLEQKTNPVALEVLQELLFEAKRAQRDLTIVLTRLNMHRQSIEVTTTQHISLGLDHMLKIPALFSEHKDLQESEIDNYYKQVSLFAPHEKKRSTASNGITTESDPYIEFRRWLGSDPEREEQLFQGDIERLRQMSREYVQQIVGYEFEKNSILEILLRDKGLK